MEIILAFLLILRADLSQRGRSKQLRVETAPNLSNTQERSAGWIICYRANNCNEKKGKASNESLWQIAACFANKQTGIKGTPASTEDCLVVKSCGVDAGGCIRQLVGRWIVGRGRGGQGQSPRFCRPQVTTARTSE